MLAAFFTVVGAGALFACPFMQAPSCCSKTSQGHCPSEQPENCLLAVSENKVSTAKPNLAATVPPPAIAEALPEQARQTVIGEPPVPAHDGRDTHLLNRVFLI